MPELWKILIEITVEPQDFRSGDTNGFMNVITWADSLGEARAKTENYFATFNWHVVEIEDAVVVEMNDVFDDDEFHELVERAIPTQTL